MSFFNEYPYRNLTDLNLDWLLNAIRTLRHDVDDFVTMNAIKYADPIDWDITRQYEKNTVVIDANTGVAYLSVAPVPSGVNITRPEYWTVIFDLSRFLTAGVSNLANSYESQLTYNATMETTTGGWVMWNGTLYEALNDIHIGDRYVPDGNIKKTTVEEFVSKVIASINAEIQNRIDADGVLQNHIDAEAQARQDADGVLRDHIDAEAQARQDADGVLQGHIDAEAQARQDADGVLQGHIDAEAQTRQDADGVLQEHIDAEAQARQDADGNLNDLRTTNKSSLVAAINEVLSDAGLKTVKDYGAVGDGVTDDTQAIEDCVSHENIVIFPSGDYVYAPDDDASPFTNKTFLGYGATILSSRGIRFNNSNVYGLVLDTVNGVLAREKVSFDNCTFLCSRHATNINNALDVTDGACVFINNCLFDGDLKATMGIWADESGGTAKIVVQNSTFRKFYLNAIFSSAHEIIIDNCYFNDNHYQTSPTGGGQIDIGAKAGVKTNACVRNCQFWGGYTATCGVETAGAYGLFITIQDCVINSQNGTWCIALQDGTFAVITGNFLYSNASYPNISLTGGSEAVSNANYMIGTKYSDATKVKNYGEFT